MTNPVGRLQFQSVQSCRPVAPPRDRRSTSPPPSVAARTPNRQRQSVADRHSNPQLGSSPECWPERSGGRPRWKPARRCASHVLARSTFTRRERSQDTSLWANLELMEDAENPLGGAVVAFGTFRLYAAARLLKNGDETVALGGRALDILITLVERAGDVVTQKDLISRVWPDVTVEEANLRVHIASLRKALGDGREGARYVVNVPGRGYCFVAPVTRPAIQPTSSPAAVVGTNRLQKLPARLVRVVGRADTVRTLSAQLMTWRFVSIVGPGGIGKTTVAVSVSHALFDGFTGGVFFVDLAPLADPQLVPTVIASALGLMVQTRDAVVSLLTFIGDRKILLVLDNCEHVIDVAAPLAERLVSEAPQAHVLATSREALRVQGEHVHRLPALEYPLEDAGLTAVEALRYGAVQLFMERAEASGHGSELSDAEAPVVTRICRRLDGIPLAIELAASRVGSYGLRGTAELLDNRFGSLWHGRRTALPRHQTLNAMLEWSYTLLSEHEKVVLRRQSVFVADFSLEAAGSIAFGTEARLADVMTAVESLVAKSLMVPSIIDGSTYYRLLDTTRVYALKRLDESGERDLMARRHALYFRDLFAPPASGFGSRVPSGDLIRYGREIDNVRTALDWCFSPSGDTAIGVDLTTSYAPVWMALSLTPECCARCERALTRPGPDPHSNAWSQMWLRIALGSSLISAMGSSERALTVLSEALAIADELKDLDAQARALSALATVYTYRGEYGQAATAIERLWQVAHRIGDPAILIVAERNMGASLLVAGRLVEAQQCFERVLRSPVVPGDQRRSNWQHSEHRAMARANLARTLWLQGFADKALAEGEASLDELQNAAHQLSLCRVLYYGMCRITLMMGDLAAADRAIARLVEVATRLHEPFWKAVGRFQEGKLMVARREFENGAEVLRDAFDTCRRTGWRISYSEFKGAHAEALAGMGHVSEALAAIENAVASARQSKNSQGWYAPELLRIKGQVLLQQGSSQSISTAEECFWQARELAGAQGALSWELRIALSHARLKVSQGCHDEARQVLASVYGRFTEGFGTADLEAARTTLDALASSRRPFAKPD